MNLADWIFERSAATTPGPTDDWWYGRGPSTAGTYAGMSVTPDLALQLSTIHACVRLIAMLAYLPLRAFRRLPDGKSRDRADDHPLSPLFRFSPNPLQSTCEFRAMMTVNKLLHGNAYAERVAGSRGATTELWPLRPGSVRVRVGRDGRTPIYHVLRPNGTEDVLDKPRVFHLKDFYSVDGIVGISRIEAARQGIALSLAAQAHGARHFGQGATPAVAVKTQKRLSDKAFERMRAYWHEVYGGALNTGVKTAFLEEGAEIEALSLTNEQAQFLQTREFQVADHARLFGVPLFLLQEHQKQTSFGAGIEQQSLAFVSYTEAPHMINWEQAINLQLVDRREWGQTYFKHNVDALVRGDTKTRTAAYASAIEHEWLSPDEVREREDMNPREDGAGGIYKNPKRSDPRPRRGSNGAAAVIPAGNDAPLELGT